LYHITEAEAVPNDHLRSASMEKSSNTMAMEESGFYIEPLHHPRVQIEPKSITISS